MTIMDKEQVKAIWAAPIRSYEDYERAYNSTVEYLNDMPRVYMPIGSGDVELSDTNEDRWPLYREINREAVGVYPAPTSVLEYLRSSYGMAGQYFPHVSPSDPQMIAYTPDRACAEGDRQIKTTMGKFLRKFLLVVTDKEIARLEAEHRSDMDPSFLVARSIEEIERVYTTMRGDTGCMRYDKSQWNHKNYHPSAVYSAPGFGVAYLAGADGTPKARSVIYDNPDDPKDKRYVRLYGDHNALRRRLELAGYVLAGLKGAKIAALQESHQQPDLYVMPYLDNPGGGSSKNLQGSNVVKWEEDGDFFTVIDDTQASKLARAGISYATCRNTGGAVLLETQSRGEMSWVCALSGTSYSRYDVTPAKALLDDGSVGLVHQDTALERGYANSIQRVIDGRNVSLMCPGSLQERYGVPGFRHIFNDAETRRYQGIVPLSTKYYPSDDGTVRYFAGRLVETVDGECIHTTDAVRVFCVEDAHDVGYGSGYVTIHSSEVGEMRKKGYLNCATSNGLPALVHKDHPAMVTTGGGRRAVKGHHDVVQDIFGGWGFSTRMRSRSLLGGDVFFQTEADLTQPPAPEVVKTLHAHVMGRLVAADERSRRDWLRARLIRGMGTSDKSVYVDGEGKARFNPDGVCGSRISVEQFIAGVDMLNTMPMLEFLENSVVAYGSGHMEPVVYPELLMWARCARILMDQIDEAVKAKRDAEIAAAEANATNANDTRFALAA